MDVGDLAGNPLAQLAAAIVTIAGGYRIWRNQQAGDAKERADSDGQIAALETWKQLLEGERAARQRAEERADKFAAERNEAMQQVYEMKGQLKAMAETLNAQTNELQALREQVRELKEKLND